MATLVETVVATENQRSSKGCKWNGFYLREMAPHQAPNADGSGPVHLTEDRADTGQEHYKSRS